MSEKIILNEISPSEIDRLITPSQFDKINSFSTTLIRVLSNFDQKYRNLCEVIEVSDNEKNQEFVGTDTNASLPKEERQAKKHPVPSIDVLVPNAVDWSSSFRNLEQKIIELANSLEEEKAKSNRYGATLMSMHGSLGSYITRADHQNEIQSLQLKFMNPMMETQNSTARTMEALQKQIRGYESTLDQMQSQYQQLEKSFATYRLGSNHEMMELLRKQEEAFAAHVAQLFAMMRAPSSHSHHSNSDISHSPELSSEKETYDTQISPETSNRNSDSLIEKDEAKIDVPSQTLESKVHDLNSKLLYQEFELNQLKSKLKNDLESMNARSQEGKESVLLLNQTYASQERWNGSIDKIIQQIQLSVENHERELGLLNSRLKFNKPMMSSPPGENLQLTPQIVNEEKGNETILPLEPIVIDKEVISSPINNDPKQENLEFYELPNNEIMTLDTETPVWNEIDLTPRVHRERIDSIPSISDVTLQSRRESHLIDKSFFDTLENLKKQFQNLNQRITNNENYLQRLDVSLQCILDNLVKMGHNAEIIKNKSTSNTSVGIEKLHSISEEDENEILDNEQFENSNQLSRSNKDIISNVTTTPSSASTPSDVRRLLEDNESLQQRVNNVETSLKKNQISVENFLNSFISMSDNIMNNLDHTITSDDDERLPMVTTTPTSSSSDLVHIEENIPLISSNKFSKSINHHIIKKKNDTTPPPPSTPAIVPVINSEEMTTKISFILQEISQIKQEILPFKEEIVMIRKEFLQNEKVTLAKPSPSPTPTPTPPSTSLEQVHETSSSNHINSPDNNKTDNDSITNIFNVQSCHCSDNIQQEMKTITTRLEAVEDEINSTTKALHTVINTMKNIKNIKKIEGRKAIIMSNQSSSSSSSSSPLEEPSYHGEVDMRLSTVEDILQSLCIQIQNGGNSAFIDIKKNIPNEDIINIPLVDPLDHQEQPTPIISTILSDTTSSNTGANASTITPSTSRIQSEHEEYLSSISNTTTNLTPPTPPPLQTSSSFNSLSTSVDINSLINLIEATLTERIQNLFLVRFTKLEDYLNELPTLFLKQANEVQKLYERIGIERSNDDEDYTLPVLPSATPPSPSPTTTATTTAISSSLPSLSPPLSSNDNNLLLLLPPLQENITHLTTSLSNLQQDYESLSSDIINKIQSQFPNILSTQELLLQQFNSLKLLQSDDFHDLTKQINNLHHENIQERREYKEKYLDLEKRLNDLDKEIGMNMLPKDYIEQNFYNFLNEIKNMKKLFIDKDQLLKYLEKKLDKDEYQRLITGLTSLIGDPFATLSSNNPSAMYKCLVCDKPVNITTTPTPASSSSSSSIDNNSNSSIQLITKYEDDLEHMSFLHSPIKKISSNSTTSSMNQQPSYYSSPMRNSPTTSATTTPSPSSPSPDLPLPPVRASPAQRSRASNSRAGSQLSRRLRSSAGGGIGIK